MRKNATKTVRIALLAIMAALPGLTMTAPSSADTPPLLQWAQRYTVSGYNSTMWGNKPIAVDGSGNAYITGATYNGSNMDMTTIKYSQAGVEQWVRRYNHGDGQDQGSAIAVDASGNAYVAGYGQNADGNFDLITVKYSPDGSQLWARAYDNSSRDEKAIAIALDSLGNAYLTGLGDIPTPAVNYLTVKYDSAGNFQWASYYNGPSNFSAASSIAVDTAGNAYVTGESRNTDGNIDYATVKYRGTDGYQLWAARHDWGGDDNANSIAVDAGGNAYVTGSINNPAMTESNYATVKYSTAGDELWAKLYSGPIGSFNGASALALDSGGNAFVTGNSFNAGGKQDMCTIKYSPAGSELWVSRYIGPTDASARGSAVAVDGSGNAYVTGVGGSLGSAAADFATVKYGPGGEQLWAVRYNGPANREDKPFGIAVNGSDVYVTGQSTNAGTKWDFATVKYAQGLTVSSASPSTGTQGQCPITVTIRGNNFAGATAVSFGVGITVYSFTVDNAGQITAVICIGESAAAGPHGISVTSPLGTTTLQGGFVTVLPMPIVASGSGIGIGPQNSSATMTAPLNQGAPVVNAVILAQSASLSAASVAPGMPVTVTADLANRSSVNGAKNITVYVNGRPETSRGVSMGSGSSTQVDFSITRSEPGTYSVYVDGTPAGSFKVESASGSDIILIASATLLAVAFIAGMFMLARRKRA